MKTTKNAQNAQNVQPTTKKEGKKKMNAQNAQNAQSAQPVQNAQPAQNENKETKMLPLDIVNGMPVATEYDDSGKAITTKSDNIFEKDMLPFMSCADDFKDKPIGQLIKEYNKYGLNARIGLLEQGGILKKIKDTGAFKEMSKTFDDFMKSQGIAKATGYRYINGYKLCCDAFGKVKPDVLALGSAIVNKAGQIGFSREGFQKVVEKAKADNVKLTADNITDIADKIGVSYDKDKAPKAKAKTSKPAVTVKPDVKSTDRRFEGVNGKTELYFDISKDFDSLAPAEYGEKVLTKSLGNFTTNGDVTVHVFDMGTTRVVVLKSARGIPVCYSCIIPANDRKAKTTKNTKPTK